MLEYRWKNAHRHFVYCACILAFCAFLFPMRSALWATIDIFPVHSTKKKLILFETIQNRNSTKKKNSIFVQFFFISSGWCSFFENVWNENRKRNFDLVSILFSQFSSFVCMLAAIENCPTEYLHHLSQNFNLRKCGCENGIKRKTNWGKIRKEKSCFKLKNEWDTISGRTRRTTPIIWWNMSIIQWKRIS